MQTMRYLVVGGDSLIGMQIVQLLQTSGEEVVITTRRCERISSDCIYLDLSEPVSRWEIPSNIRVAFLCAAATSQTFCTYFPDVSRKINTTNISILAKRLVASGAFVIFPSTNLVLSGERPFQSADSKLAPRTEYGKQKADAEAVIRTMEEKVAIIRLSKVFGKDNQLISEWADQLLAGKVIRPIKDMYLSPICLDFVSDLFVEIGTRQLSGLWQVSASQDISYTTLAGALAKTLSVDQSLLDPWTAQESKMPSHWLPRHTTMDATRMNTELDRETPSAWDAVKKILENYRVVE